MNIIEFIESEQFLGHAFKRRKFRGDSWRNWKVYLKCLWALPLAPDELKLFRACTGRSTPPTQPFTECFTVSGRRSGKSHVVSAIGCYMATAIDFTDALSTGEVASIPIFASTKEQAGIIFGYVRAFLTNSPALNNLIVSETKDTITLRNLFGNAVEICIVTSDYRAIRGRAVPCALLDEICFWEQDAAGLLEALRPAMIQFPNPLLAAISSAYRKSGTMYEMLEKYHGQDISPVLAWRSTSLQMNLSMNRAAIALAYARDAVASRSEYGSLWREDIASYVSAEVLDRCIIPGRRSLPYDASQKYFCFVDLSGGVVDAAAACIGHRGTNGKIIADALLEIPSPHSPQVATKTIWDVARLYHCSEIVGDKYSGNWAVDSFASLGAPYVHASHNRNGIYLETLPVLTSGMCELPDEKKMRAQFLALERKTGRNQDLVDHPRGGHDDSCNAVAGLIAMLADDTRIYGVLDYAKKHAWDGFADDSPKKGVDPDVVRAPETQGQRAVAAMKKLLARSPHHVPAPAKWNADPPPACPECKSTCVVWITYMSQAHCQQCSTEFWPNGKPIITYATRDGVIGRRLR